MKEGELLNITCRARMGPENSSVMWLKENRPIKKGRNSFLVIQSINRSQAGNYMCVSLSQNGNHSSPFTAVDVLCEYFQVCSAQHLLNRGPRSPSVFCTKVSSLFSRSSILFLNNQELFDKKHSHRTIEEQIKPTRSLTLREFRFSLLDKPRIFKPMKQLTLELTRGNSTTLECTADANPFPIFTWHTEGGDIKQGFSNTSNSSYLAVTPINDSDVKNYMYKCVATNKLGFDSVTFTLIEKSKYCDSLVTNSFNHGYCIPGPGYWFT